MTREEQTRKKDRIVATITISIIYIAIIILGVTAK